MTLAALEERIFAIDRKVELVLTIGGQIIPMGLDANGNTKGVDVDFDIEQIPPTAAISFAKEQQTEKKSGLPTWVETGMDVYIDAGYDGEIVRIFTGRAKRPRHGVAADTLDCVGRTGKLTRPYRAEAQNDPTAKIFTSIEARAAIIDILNDYGVDFTPANNERYAIDPILMDDGSPWIMATVVDAVMDMAPPSDMIRKIADVYGHRVYELPSGTLCIRDLLEVPAPEGFRTYSTDASAVGVTTQTTQSYTSVNIDTAAAVGDVAARARRAVSFVASASGGPQTISVWARRVAAPIDGFRLSIYRDDGAGLPSTAADAVVAIGDPVFNGQLFDLVAWTKVEMTIPAAATLISGDTYHIVIDRDGALDAVNYYEIGMDAPANISYNANPDAWALPEDPWAGGAVGILDSSIYITDNAAADFGNTSIGSLQLAVSAEQQDARQVVLPAGTYTSISAYGLMTAGGARDALFALYDDVAGVPTNLLAYTAGFVVGVAPAAWYSDNIAFNPAGGAIASIVLGAGTYWISVLSRYGGGFTGEWYYDQQNDSGGASSLEGGGGWAAVTDDTAYEIVTSAFATQRVLNISDDEDEDQIRKKIVVKGAVYPGTVDGDETPSQVKASIENDSNELVPGNPDLFAMTYLNDLIDTDQVAVDVARRLLDKFGRALQTIEIEVPFDPRMSLGTTITIDDPAVTGHGGNWWVHGYHHSLSPSTAVTRLSLFGGDQSGTTGEMLPQPDFTWVIERELIGNALMAIVTFTSTSREYDGWITNYRWTDNYDGGANDVSGEMTTVTFAYDPAVDPAIQMVLTVTDNHGNVVSTDLSQGSVDVTTDNSDIYAPVVSCAGGNTCMATFDGGMSWMDIATPSGSAVVTALTHNPATPQEEMVVLFGTDNGRIYRSIDGMQTLVLEYTDSDGDAITAIEPDTDRRGVVWATTTDRVLLSLNYGDTWGIYTDFNNSANWPRVTSTTVMAPDAINGSKVLGDTSVRSLWATVFNPDITGTLGRASFWMQRVGTPTDSVRMHLYTNAAGKPDTILATSAWVAGSTISNAALVEVAFGLTNRVLDNTTYHLVIERSGPVDAANHYLVAYNNSGASDYYDSTIPDWVAVADGLVFEAAIISGDGHVAPSPPDPRPINAIEVSDAEVNRLWIFGGQGDVVESWVATNYIPNGGALWHSEIAQGQGVGATPRNAADTVVDFVVSHATSSDLGLIFERVGGGVPDNPYIFASPFYPISEADWRVGAGAMVTPGADGVSVAGNNNQVEQFGAFLDNTNFYVANDGRSFWPHTAVLPGTGANRPNDLVSVRAWQDMYLGATDEGIVKSIDNGATWNFFRPVAAPISTVWPAGAIGWDIAIEYRRPRSYNLAVIVRDAAGSTENALAVRTSTGGWEDHGPLPTAHSNTPHRLWHFPQISDQVLFYVRYTAAGFGHSEVLYRTPDQGTTWTSLGVAPMLYTYAMARSGDGTLWASGESHAGGHGGLGHFAHEIFRSIDDGLTWEKVYEDTVATGTVRSTFKDVAVDPNDPNRVMFIGVHQGAGASSVTLFSADATEGLASNWDRQITGLDFENTAAIYCTPFILAGDAERWIIGFMPAGVNRMRIYTNDQNGVPAAWDLQYDITTAGSTFGFADRARAGNILYAIGTQVNEGPGLLRSINNGSEWKVVGVQTSVGAGIWDAQTDMFIQSRRQNTDRFPYYQPPTEGAIAYLGIDTGLDAAMGYTTAPMTQGMVLLRDATGTEGAPTELWAIAQLAAAGGDTDIWLREAISDSWRNYLDIPNTLAAENRFPIWHFDGMGDVMFRLKIGDLGSAASGYGGDLERSDNRGLTWAVVLSNVGALTRGRNGDLWATADDRAAPASFQPRSIYRSRAGDGNSVGIVWSLMGTDTTAGAGAVMTKYTQIRVDPNNASRIMAVGGLETDTMRSAYSPDGGATWTYRSGVMSFRDGTAALGNFINLEAGGAERWIIGLSQADGLAKFIFVSDDFGETWVQKYTVVTTAVCHGWVDSVRAGGGNLFLAGNGGGAANAVDGRVVLSEDNGDTWAPFTGDDRTDIMAVTYDNNQSTLYIGRASAASNVLYMKNPSVLGIWSDDSIPSDPRFILQESLKVVT